MPNAKTIPYDKKVLEVALVAKALGHPSRLKMLELIGKKRHCKDLDLMKELHLSKASVHNHIFKLSQAQLVNITYLENDLIISLKANGIDSFINFMEP